MRSALSILLDHFKGLTAPTNFYFFCLHLRYFIVFTLPSANSSTRQATMTTPPRTPPGTTRKADRNVAVHRPSASSGPSTSSITSSLTHVQSDNTEYEDERPNTPPPYSAPTTASMVVAPTGPPQQPTYPGLPRLDYRLYSPKTFTLSPKNPIPSSSVQLSLSLPLSTPTLQVQLPSHHSSLYSFPPSLRFGF